MLVRAMAKNRRMGGTGEVSKEERSRLSELSKSVIDANDAFTKDLAESKEANVANRVMEFIEFTQGIRRVSAGEVQPSPKQEMQRFFSMLKASPNDPMSVGLAVRGMARSIAEGMGVKGKMTAEQANKVIDEVHSKMQKVMGDSWTKTQTNDALQGNGAFTQFAESDLKNAVDASIRSQEQFVRDYEMISKIKNAKERNRRLDQLAEKRNIEFDNIESQMKTIVDEELVDISKYIGELDYELRSCE
jgi:polyhydroxyalkanoate synthesis regulator phasin